MTIMWWNSFYPIRRNIHIVNTGIDILEAGSPIFLHLDFAGLLTQEKARYDAKDIEILYWNESAASPYWSMLARSTEYDDMTEVLSIVFNIVNDIDISDLDNYFIYMSNPNLKGDIISPQYTSAEFSKVATPTNGGIMFTKPTEEWNNGVSLVANAKAAFSFYGKNIKLFLENGPDRGIVELKVNDEPPQFKDTFQYNYDSATPAYTRTNLPIGKQYIRLRATGEKNPSSSADTIKIAQIQYSNYIFAALGLEEIYSTSDVLMTMIGA